MKKKKNASRQVDTYYRWSEGGTETKKDGKMGWKKKKKKKNKKKKKKKTFCCHLPCCAGDLGKSSTCQKESTKAEIIRLQPKLPASCVEGSAVIQRQKQTNKQTKQEA